MKLEDNSLFISAIIHSIRSLDSRLKHRKIKQSSQPDESIKFNIDVINRIIKKLLLNENFPDRNYDINKKSYSNNSKEILRDMNKLDTSSYKEIQVELAKAIVEFNKLENMYNNVEPIIMN
ncbi:hypothetical protein [Tenacibaculum halocynthiae]|uniref:hypothetical protein n=1 Tax=Tenacibaculum halocynthiae TaxID=1254437 RepID=UPI003D652C58